MSKCLHAQGALWTYLKLRTWCWPSQKAFNAGWFASLLSLFPFTLKILCALNGKFIYYYFRCNYCYCRECVHVFVYGKQVGGTITKWRLRFALRLRPPTARQGSLLYFCGHNDVDQRPPTIQYFSRMVVSCPAKLFSFSPPLRLARDRSRPHPLPSVRRSHSHQSSHYYSARVLLLHNIPACESPR